jgi:hypothetical protein
MSSRKCIVISYEFLEDLLGITREEGKILSVEGNASCHSLKVFYESPGRPESFQDSEAWITQSLRTLR